MTNDPTNEFPLTKDAYAAFDAISLRNLIIERLNNQGIFTDQNYIGSNLASIIDIISYSFNTLIYYLNRTSTESMFTEAQLYENINKIVKLLDYNPVGYQTSTLTFECSASNLEAGSYTIPRYSYILIGNVPFSFNEDITFNVPTSNSIANLSDLSNKKLLYQGTFRENPLYTSAGEANEVVAINVTNALVDHFNIFVYVYETKQSKWFQYKNVPNFYSEQALSRSFEKRLNSSGIYEITFGDGINGRKLNAGDKVAIYFLQSSGEQGVVGPNAFATLRSNPVVYTTTTFSSILADVNEERFRYTTASQFKNVFFNNVAGSTIPKDAESIDSIKKNAPSNFKMQYRLVTKEDFETYIKTYFAAVISNVKIFSNWEYTAYYLKYFEKIQVSPTSFRQILLNQVLYADNCNFNNIYVCALPRVSQGSSLKYLLPAQKEIILSNIQTVKPITTEVTFADPIFKAISFGVKINAEAVVVDDKDFCVLEITKSPSSRRSANSLALDAELIIKNFFNPLNASLGTVFDHNSLYSQLLNIDGVAQIKTKRLDTNDEFNGISFFIWNPSYPDLDKEYVISNLELNPFEVLYFEDLQNVFSKIVVTETPTFV